jgi:hypothetical protein
VQFPAVVLNASSSHIQIHACPSISHIRGAVSTMQYRIRPDRSDHHSLIRRCRPVLRVVLRRIDKLRADRLPSRLHAQREYFDTCFLSGLTSCSVPYYPGWYGDGASTIQATARDVFGTTVATSSVVPFLNRTIGFPFSLPSGLSGTGSVTICANTFDGLCATGQNPGNC